ncbi:hypothetical protein CI105_08440 [Candidatus Izimaplasma bacterium ZiA1]|uniref:sensor histidine kinase n=1 Tax=Candidatus Izimoplasma sp. ZiA1 TaxID=2024899 RepID=UPI000BAA611E|nr:hypothetical protein CI105_08440 [Candidatus Izimaplasma bacterium ZiA1]
MKLTTKILFFLTLAAIIIPFVYDTIFSLIIPASVIDDAETLEDIAIYIWLFVGSMLILTIISFYIILNRIVIKRVKKLNLATIDVMNGKYTYLTKIRSKDEIGSLSRNFNKMIAALENNEYQNKTFMRDYSHELKTPLSSIKGYADLIQKDSTKKDKVKEYALIISEQSNRLAKLSQNLLKISQIDNKVIIPLVDNTDLSEVIREVVLFTQLKWEAKNIEFNLELEKINIFSSKELLYQILINLISNAIKFSKESSIIGITLSNTLTGPKITVSNEGEIKEEHINHVFDLFFTTNKHQERLNNGVGLTLTKKIIEKLNGTIDVVSENNLVTFSVILPKK